MYKSIDRELLYEYLWGHTNRDGKLTLKPASIAYALDVSFGTVNGILRDYVATGRMRKIGRDFYLTDPAVQAWEQPPQPPKRATP